MQDSRNCIRQRQPGGKGGPRSAQTRQIATCQQRDDTTLRYRALVARCLDIALSGANRYGDMMLVATLDAVPGVESSQGSRSAE